MRNKIKVVNKVNKFFLESIIILFPLCISYVIFGIWLSDATDFGRGYLIPSDVTDLREVYGSVVYGFIEFNSFDENLMNFHFRFSHVYWGALILSVLLVVIGRLLAKFLLRNS